MKSEKLLKAIAIASPYIAGTVAGGATGAAVAEDKKRGAVKGALIGLGSVAGGKLSNRVKDITLKKMFGNKLADAEQYLAIRASKGLREAVIFADSKGYSADEIKAFGDIIQKGQLTGAGITALGGAASLAGSAYALKNDSNSKKR